MVKTQISQPVLDNSSRLLWSKCDTSPYSKSIDEACLLVPDASKISELLKSDDISKYRSILLLKIMGRDLSKTELEAVNFITNEMHIPVNIQEFKVVIVNSNTDVLKLCNIRLEGNIIFGIANDSVSQVVIDNCNELSNGVFVFNPLVSKL